MEVKTFDPFDVYAYCLWDASLMFHEPLRSKVRTPFKGKPSCIRGPIITGMCLTAHEALYSVEPGKPDHYWVEDITTGERAGSLPKALSTTAEELSAALKGPRFEQAVALCGKLSHLLIDALVGVNLIEFDGAMEVRARIAQDLTDHITDLPFISDEIIEGDNYLPGSPIMVEKRAATFLEDHRQVCVNIANAYLYGNGWPAARGQLEKSYNRATNILARTAVVAEEK